MCQMLILPEVTNVLNDPVGGGCQGLVSALQLTNLLGPHQVEGLLQGGAVHSRFFQPLCLLDDVVEPLVNGLGSLFNGEALQRVDRLPHNGQGGPLDGAELGDLAEHLCVLSVYICKSSVRLLRGHLSGDLLGDHDVE